MGSIQLSLLDEDAFYCYEEEELAFGCQCPVPSAQWALTTHPGSDAFDAKNCWWVDFSGGRGWRCVLLLWERGVLLMGVVQYCGRTLVTGQLAWRCTQANITSKIYFTAQLFSLGPLWISLGVSLPVIWVQSVAWIGRLSSDWCHNWFPARPNRRRTAFQQKQQHILDWTKQLEATSNCTMHLCI